MKNFIIIVTIIFLYFSENLTPAFAAQKDEEAFAAFETFCLFNMNNPKNIESMLSSAGNKLLPKEMSDAILAPKKGKAWMIKKGVSVGLTNDGVCIVAAPYVNGDETKNLFQKYVKNIKITSENMGSQVQDIYAVTYPSLETGDLSRMIVFITTTNLKSINGIIFNALPEKLAIENNIKIHDWPK